MAKRSSPDRLLPKQAQSTLRRAALLSAVAAALWPLQALALAWGIGGWVAGAGPQAGFVAAGCFALLGVVRAVIDRVAARLAFHAADGVIHDLRQSLLTREARRPGAAASSAALAAMLTEKLAILGPWITRYRPAMARTKLVPLLILALAFYVSWAVGVIFLVAGPLIPVFMALVGMAAKEASTRQMVEIGDMNTLLIDRIAALPDILLLNAGDASRAAFEARAEGLRARTMAVLRVAFLSSTVLELFSAIGVALVAVYVGFSLLGELNFGTWGTGLTLGEGVFLLLLAPDYFQPLRDLAAGWHDKAAAEAVADELDALEADETTPVLGQGARAEPLAGPASVVLSGVAVTRGTLALRLPDLAVAPGESVALSGPSGVGKSTALDLIAGLLTPAEGQVTVAGQVLGCEIADAWRARVAYVPQSVHVPDMTLHRFLDPHDLGADLEAALRKARAEGIVAALPEGLETVLGETGAGVSGGEARRLLLARAFLTGADVILADEPTADLDAANGAAIIEALAALAAEGRTVIVATHDPALAAAMGRVVRFGEDAA
ncbi:ATP-binding cassette domain-containing protein [Salipiger sp. P9]|uniref:ABC transporter ATP-binding protein/permease n=1 Tax=Salipiger pentaromativorans TaxID=2943193 RepID=UPI00215840AC|nr:ATP-binding cassette domain-containing protein [Salipiger pentaromativorans]MCR8549384.1 ATP-binding cassette domain-containing protein [Salipiger pentaromativorans]